MRTSDPKEMDRTASAANVSSTGRPTAPVTRYGQRRTYHCHSGLFVPLTCWLRGPQEACTVLRASIFLTKLSLIVRSLYNGKDAAKGAPIILSLCSSRESLQCASAHSLCQNEIDHELCMVHTARQPTRPALKATGAAT